MRAPAKETQHMIYSHKLKFQEVRIKTNENGDLVLIWNCPFCKREEIEGFSCGCGAEIPGIIVTKDYNGHGKPSLFMYKE